MKRTTRKRLGDCSCGDIVRLHAGHVELHAIVFNIINGRVWVRYADCVSYREISEPAFLSPDTEVEVMRSGLERYPKQGWSEVDPLKAVN